MKGLDWDTVGKWLNRELIVNLQHCKLSKGVLEVVSALEDVWR